MSNIRKIRQTIRSKPTLEGAGVHLHRAFGSSRDAIIFDPFLLLDDFRNDYPQNYAPGFPWHPHRGIETITYVLTGTVEHRDSMGNRGEITAGDVQWMTAGSGVKHQEMPKGDPEGRMSGFQLWANLPKSHKMIDPRYQGISSSQIPKITLDNQVEVKVVCGEFEGIKGPVENVVIDPLYLDITIPAKATFTFSTSPTYTALAYVIDGKASFSEETDPFDYQREGSNYFDMEHGSLLGDQTLILFEDGEEIKVVTKNDLVRFLFVSGKPINEPIAWYGPIVMNTEQELRQAFMELQNGTFIKTSA